MDTKLCTDFLFMYKLVKRTASLEDSIIKKLEFPKRSYICINNTCNLMGKAVKAHVIKRLTEVNYNVLHSSIKCYYNENQSRSSDTFVVKC